MKTRLLATSAIAGLAFFAATPAFATCSPAPSDGATVNCSANDTAGVQGAANTGLTVTVDPGVEIHTASDPAIAVGTGAITLGAGASAISDTGIGILVDLNGNGGSINIGTNAIVSGTQGIYVGSGGADIIIGTGAAVTGTGGTAIQLGSGDSTVSITNTSTITGLVMAGAGTNDTLVYNDAAGGTFDTNLFTSQFQGFENATKNGNTVTTLSNAVAKNWNVLAGTLIADTTQLLNADIGASGLLQIANSGTATYSGNITGAGEVLKDGGGFLTLSGNNSFTGDLTIRNSTTLTLASNAAAAAADTINVDQSTLAFGAGFNNQTLANDVHIGASSATLDTGNSTVTASGVISSDTNGGLVKDGSGTLILSNTNNTYDGGTLIIGGAVQAAADGSLGTGDIGLNSGTLRMGANFDTAKNITLTGAGTIDTNTHSGEFSGTVSGAGALTVSGGGTLELTGANGGYSQALTVSGGTTLATNATGSGTGELTLNASTFQYLAAFDQSRDIELIGDTTIDTGAFNTILSGTVFGSQTATLTKTGSGILQLTGNNGGGADTLDGGIIIEGGTLAVTTSGNLGSNNFGTNAITLDGGTLRTDGNINTDRDFAVLGGDGTIDTNNHNLTVSGVLSGAGDLTKTGDGILTLSGTNTNSGKIIANDGTLAVASSAALGDGSGTNTVELSNGAELRYTANLTNARDLAIGAGSGTITANTGTTAVMSGVISGTTGLTKDGAGTLALSVTNTYTGITTITAGKLRADTVNAISDDIDNSGTLEFSTASGETYAGDITGSGALAIDGGISLTLTGDNDFTGATTVSNSSLLQLADAGALSGTSSITLDESELRFGSGFDLDRDLTLTGAYNQIYSTATNAEISSTIGGTGELVKTGSGKLILSGVNTYSGDTQVVGGILAVNGTITGLTDVLTGATLGGTGTVGSVSVASGGNFAPGNSIGTITTTGNVDFLTGSKYTVEYNPTTADKIVSGGAITIANGVTLDLQGASGSYPTTRTYTILEGTAINGEFDTITNTLAFLDETMIYNATNVQMRLDRNDVGFGDVAKDSGQQGVANAITALGTGNAVYDQFTGLTTTQAQKALDDLSGEHNAGTITAMAQSTNAVRGMVSNHLAGLSHLGSTGDFAALSQQDLTTYTAAYIEPAAGGKAPAWDDATLWFEAIGTRGQSAASGASPSQKRKSYGGLAGVDVPTENGHLGAYAGYERSDSKTKTQGAKSDTDNYHVGVYGSRKIGKGMTFAAGVGGTYHTVDTARDITVGTTSFAPRGETTGTTVTAFAEISKPYDIEIHKVKLAAEPYANLAVTSSHTNGYTETGGGAANLTVDEASQTNPVTTLGVRFGKEIHVTDATAVALSGNVGWQHTYGNVNPAGSMRFATGGTSSFAAAGTPIAKDAAVVGLTASTQLKDKISAYLGYNGTISGDAQDHGITVGVKIKF